jgi:hypothetical protein
MPSKTGKSAQKLCFRSKRAHQLESGENLIESLLLKEVALETSVYTKTPALISWWFVDENEIFSSPDQQIAA